MYRNERLNRVGKMGLESRRGFKCGNERTAEYYMVKENGNLQLTSSVGGRGSDREEATRLGEAVVHCARNERTFCARTEIFPSMLVLVG